MPSYRIVIVEDQREISRLLRSALETLEEDIRVIEVTSGEEAILEVAHFKVDLLVADFRLPGMSGIDLMTKVREEHPTMKVILITGQPDPRIRKAVAEAGADAFFLKPIPMADFLDAVERHLGLVETILPPEPLLIPEVPSLPRSSIPDVLTSLRQEMNASAVLLLNDSGQVLARAGELPNTDVEVSLLTSVLSIFSAGLKVAHMLGQKEFSSWTVFNGGEYDLIFCPIGEGTAVLSIGQALASEKSILKAVGMLTEARSAIMATMKDAIEPLVAMKSENEPPAAPLEAGASNEKEMEPILKEGRKKLKQTDVDDFWNKAAKKHKAPAKPDMLSYDQAKQLGLTPEDKS
jgi:DNA-binding response OmpR family regulator